MVNPWRSRICCKVSSVASLDQSLKRMALAWILRDGDITSVLIGASKPSQILDNLGMMENTVFSKEEREKIEQVLAQ